MIDQVSDRNHAKLYDIAHSTEMPDFVKEAALTTAADVTALRRDAFADPARRRFPTHTAADTWLSYAFFAKYGGEYPPEEHALVKGNLDRAVEFWRIQAPKYNIEKQAAAMDKLAYEYEGQILATASVGSAADVRRLADDLLEHPAKYPYEMRCSAARQLLKLSSKYAAELPSKQVESLQKTAAWAVGREHGALKAIAVRRAMVPRLADRLDKAAAIVKQSAVMGMLSPGMVEKVARFVDAIDRLSNLHRHYGSGMTPPEQDIAWLTRDNRDRFLKNAVNLKNGTLLSTAEAKRPEVRRLLESLTGEKVAADQVIPRLRELSASESELVCSVLAG